MRTPKSVSHKEFIIKQMKKDPEFVKEYFFTALEENDPKYFLKVLRKIAEALNISELAKVANTSRMTIYRVLSGENNPRLDVFFGILRAIWLKLHSKKAA